jgi:hypothetical protein
MVRSRSESDEVGQYVKECQRRSGEDGITSVTYRTRSRRVRIPKGVKQRELLDPNDAYRLYDQLHFSPILVLMFSAAFVSKEPGLHEPPKQALVSVEAFVRHKAMYGLIRGKAAVGAAFDDFADWRAGVHCDGEDDPRTLPLHMFATSCDCSHLGTTAADDAFRRWHGSPARRRDDKDLDWIRADRSAYHGRPVLRVAGRELHRGMHWDVTSRRQRKVQNSIEVWRLTGSRHSYANVYPNAHIQVPPGKSTARKVWP